MSEITKKEEGTFLMLFNRNGYVLNFSTADFDVFTTNSIGVALCNKYGLSKGKSLIAYLNSATYSEREKLLLDLFHYYEDNMQHEYDKDYENFFCYNGYDERYARIYQKCKGIVERIEGTSSVISQTADNLKRKFSSEYMSQQIELMISMQSTNPTNAIGAAKELIESCCKTILEFEGCTVDKDWEVPRLVDETFKHFHLMPKNISDDVKGAKSIKAILGNLKAIAQGVAELRNLYGSGHGKSSSYKGLESRHASLAIGSSTTLVRFLWDSYERHHNNEVN